MKAPNALKRVGRSIGVIRTKVRDTVKRSHTGRGLVKTDESPVFDARDDMDAENRPVVKPEEEEEEQDPADFLSRLRSGSLEDFGMMPSDLDRALIAIENEQPDQIALPPQISREAREGLIHSPPNVKTNPVKFAEEEDTSALDVATSMARSMSNLLSKTYSKIMDETTATIQDAVSFTDSKAEDEPAQQEPSTEAESPTDNKNAVVATALPSTQEAEESRDAPATADAEAAGPDASVAVAVDVEAAATGVPIQTPRPMMPNEDDEDITVTTEGPDVVLPPTMQKGCDSLSSRSPQKKATRLAMMTTAFSNFGGKRSLTQENENNQTLSRLFDAFRDVLCCPEDQTGSAPRAVKALEVKKAPLPNNDLPNKETEQSEEGQDDDDVEYETVGESQTSDLDSEEKVDSDSFDEIAQATLLVSDMIKVKGSFTSEQCDQVEQALKVLEQKAKKIGVNESDLLAAMASSEDGSSQGKKFPSTIRMPS